MLRHDGRETGQLRSLKAELGYMEFAEGSCLFQMGRTRVLSAATVEDGVPSFLRGSGTGWVTAEYSMLPRACQSRNQRESTSGKLQGRTMEIQRLIGRACRAIVDTRQLGERTIWIDCDVLQADGGTRCASINAAYLALSGAIEYLLEQNLLRSNPIISELAAVSVGVVHGEPMVDLDYYEDSQAGVDMNIVATGKGELVEVQGSAEGKPFARKQLDNLLNLALVGCQEIAEFQREVLGRK